MNVSAEPVTRAEGTQRDDSILTLDNLHKSFRRQGAKGVVHAVNGVSIDIPRGGSLGLVGESGSGKSTTARCIMGLEPATSGRIVVDGTEIGGASGASRRFVQQKMQYVFQDPYDSLNPRWRVQKTVEEPLVIRGGMSRQARQARVGELMDLVGLGPQLLGRQPDALSGGQRQRVAIARALAAEPEVLLLDEPTSALDSLSRTGVLDLLNRLRAETGVSYLFISHDLRAVGRVCDRIAVMYLGRIVEEAPSDVLFANPRHPYTRALLSAVLSVGGTERGSRLHLQGEPPSPVSIPSGCALHPRCPVAVDRCSGDVPLLESVESPVEFEHNVACVRISGKDDIDWPAGWETR